MGTERGPVDLSEWMKPGQLAEVTRGSYSVKETDGTSHLSSEDWWWEPGGGKGDERGGVSQECGGACGSMVGNLGGRGREPRQSEGGGCEEQEAATIQLCVT